MARPRGPLPKDPAKRERSGKPTYETVHLGSTPANTDAAPKIPVRAWRKLHVETKAWWKMLLDAPQASQYLGSDWRRLRMVLLPLVEHFNRAADEGDVPKMTKLAGEIRMQEADFGLTPTSRMRNRWTVQPPRPDNEGDEGSGEERKRRRRTHDDPRLTVVK
jgi:hypothetical protein